MTAKSLLCRDGDIQCARRDHARIDKFLDYPTAILLPMKVGVSPGGWQR